jgi:hypothetical protein
MKVAHFVELFFIPMLPLPSPKIASWTFSSLS